MSYGISDLILNNKCDSIIDNNNYNNDKYKLILEICIGIRRITINSNYNRDNYL